MRHLLILLLSLFALEGEAFVKLSGALEQSDIYPGTRHTFEVVVPDGYDGCSQACLYVGLDGILCNAPAVIDSLIATGEMPMTISVYLQPGLVLAPDSTVMRYNRSNEFDATDDRFALFLETELLPVVKRMRTDDGRQILISDKGEDHMIFGLSSGGIAAFMAAWHRPDLFGRVFSGVGTFVSMRGGNDVQAIVRKSEPRPLKICLQDGTADVWNPIFGHWYEANRMLATALDFAGYDTLYDWSDCGHGVRRASEIFTDVMKWMWADWGTPIKIGDTQNGLLSEILVPGSQWEVIENFPAMNPGAPVAYYPDGSLQVTPEEHSNWLLQSTRNPNGEYVNTQRFYYLHSYDNRPHRVTALCFDADGWLYAATDEGIQVCDQNGRVRAMLITPRGVLAASLTVEEGYLLLHDARSGNLLRREFNVKPPEQGVTPKSQGQG